VLPMVNYALPVWILDSGLLNREIENQNEEAT
jgi:hypothetical protein